jgi:hypothetical protein
MAKKESGVHCLAKFSLLYALVRESHSDQRRSSSYFLYYIYFIKLINNMYTILKNQVHRIKNEGSTILGSGLTA